MIRILKGKTIPFLLTLSVAFFILSCFSISSKAEELSDTEDSYVQTTIEYPVQSSNSNTARQFLESYSADGQFVEGAIASSEQGLKLKGRIDCSFHEKENATQKLDRIRYVLPAWFVYYFSDQNYYYSGDYTKAFGTGLRFKETGVYELGTDRLMDPITGTMLEHFNTFNDRNKPVDFKVSSQVEIKYIEASNLMHQGKTYGTTFPYSENKTLLEDDYIAYIDLDLSPIGLQQIQFSINVEQEIPYELLNLAEAHGKSIAYGFQWYNSFFTEYTEQVEVKIKNPEDQLGDMGTSIEFATTVQSNILSTNSVAAWNGRFQISKDEGVNWTDHSENGTIVNIELQRDLDRALYRYQYISTLTGDEVYTNSARLRLTRKTVFFESNTDDAVQGMPVQAEILTNDIPPKLDMTPMRDGYDFKGWNTQPDGNGKTGEEAFPRQKVIQDITFYAQWMKSEGIESSVVSSSSSEITSEEQNEGSSTLNSETSIGSSSISFVDDMFPKTGDRTPLIVLVVGLAVSILGIVVFILLRRKFSK